MRIHREPSGTSRELIMRKSTLVLLLVVLGHFAASEDATAQPNNPNALRVMSFNVRYAAANDGANAWTERKDLVVKVVREFSPDLLGTQELMPVQAKYLLEKIPGYGYVGQSRRPELVDDEQCGIYYRQERFIPLQQGHFWLSQTPDVPGSRGWDAALPRMVTWTKLYDRRSGRPFYFVNTHFDHRGREARKQSARTLRSFLESKMARYPVIVTGDFNSGEGSAPYQELLANEGSAQPHAPSEPHIGLIDTYRQVHPQRMDNEGTFNGFNGRRDGERIDWILVSSDLQVESAEIVSTDFSGRYPSDHFPVTAVVALPATSGEPATQ